MNVRTIIDHQQVRRNRARARRLPRQGADFLLVRALDDLDERLASVKRTFSHALIVGPAAARIGAHVVASGRVSSFETWAEDGFEHDEIVLAGRDDEAPRFDLVICLYALHETNDTPGILVQFRRLMKADSLLLACTPGAATLQELRDSVLHADIAIYGGASPRVLPFMDVRQAGALLQRTGYAMPVTDVDDVRVRYGSFKALIDDLRAMGAKNALAGRCTTPASRAFLVAACDYYLTHHSDEDGKFVARFETIWMSGWTPGQGQPTPLKPGSATVSLADALGSGPNSPRQN